MLSDTEHLVKTVWFVVMQTLAYGMAVFTFGVVLFFGLDALDLPGGDWFLGFAFYGTIPSALFGLVKGIVKGPN